MVFVSPSTVVIFSNRRMTLNFKIFFCSWQCCSVVYCDRLPWRALQQDPRSQYNTAILLYTPCPAALWGKETPVALYIVPISSTSKVLYYILLHSRGDESLTVGRLVSLSDTVASGELKTQSLSLVWVLLWPVTAQLLLVDADTLQTT